jgi:hypothetical protein
MNAKENGLLSFSTRIQIIAQSALTVLTLTAIIYGGLAWWLMRPIKAEAQARAASDLKMIQRLDAEDMRLERLTRIAELQATFTLEPAGSVERVKALAEFRQMRRLLP